jgi:serine/threonine protein kinase
MEPMEPNNEQLPAVCPVFSGGEQLGRYEIVKLIAQGGMGDVYLAKDTTLDRSVALKCLSRKLTIDRHFVERFRREAKATAAVVHTNVVPIHELGEEDGQHYFTMEYVPGDTLAHLIKREGQLPPIDSLKIIRQAARGLSAAADSGLIHRDVKPSNILINERGTVKLTDFGLARAVEDCSRITHSDMIVGTPHYVSPEQARGDEKIDHRADIYSLGITLYHALSGTLPFNATSPMGIMLRHVNDPLPPLNELMPKLPKAVVHLVHRMVEKSADHRFQTYEELIEAIDGSISVVDDKAVVTSGKQKDFKNHFHPTMPIPTPLKECPKVEDSPLDLDSTQKRPTKKEPDLDSTQKRQLAQLHTSYEDLGGLVGTAWAVYTNPRYAYKKLALGPLRWQPPIMIGLFMAIVGYLFIPLTHVTNVPLWRAGYIVFLLTDLLFILPVYVLATPKEFPHSRLLAAVHLILISWTAQVWFTGGWLFIFAFPTPWIAYRGLKNFLGLEGGKLMAVWLICLMLFTVRVTVAVMAAGPLSQAIAPYF